MRGKFRTGGLLAGQVAGVNWVGQSVMSSGTTVLSVAATACRSGSAVFLAHNQAPNALSTSASAGFNFTASSIDNGRFMIYAVGSVAPVQSVPISWLVVRRG